VFLNVVLEFFLGCGNVTEVIDPFRTGTRLKESDGRAPFAGVRYFAILTAILRMFAGEYALGKGRKEFFPSLFKGAGAKVKSQSIYFDQRTKTQSAVSVKME